jgi:hypothetical protein
VYVDAYDDESKPCSDLWVVKLVQLRLLASQFRYWMQWCSQPRCWCHHNGFFFMCPVVLALGQHLVEVGRDCSRLVRCGPGPSAMILVWALEPISVYRCELPIVRSRQPLNDIVDGTQLIHYEVQSRV